MDSDGNQHSNHREKADTLWNAYKDGLGISEFQHMAFDLSTWFTDNPDLSFMDDPFTHVEIDMVIASLPTDKSPGADGLTQVL